MNTTPNESRENLHKLGWTFRQRFEDNDPSKPIIGVRLTNAAKIFESAQTIQIFDQATVTVQFGFLQEQSVSLTREDGAEFIDWLKQAHPDLAAPMLAAVPQGDRGPGPSISPMSTTKAELTKYLAEAWPEIFGRGGRATAPDADFFTELLKLLTDPDRDTQRRVQLILAAENMAHDFYADANAILRAASRQAELKLSDAATTELQMDAYAKVMAAEGTRLYATQIRKRLPLDKLPPPAEFPEAIDPASIPAVQNVRALTHQPEIRQRGKFMPGYANETLAGKTVSPDMMVGVVDPNHPKFRQLGQIKACGTAPGAPIMVLISGATDLEEFKPEQLMSL